MAKSPSILEGCPSNPTWANVQKLRKLGQGLAPTPRVGWCWWYAVIVVIHIAIHGHASYCNLAQNGRRTKKQQQEYILLKKKEKKLLELRRGTVAETSK